MLVFDEQVRDCGSMFNQSHAKVFILELGHFAPKMKIAFTLLAILAAATNPSITTTTTTPTTARETVIVLSAKYILPPGQDFFYLGQPAVDALLTKYNYSTTELLELRRESIRYFNERFSLGLPQLPTGHPLSKAYFHSAFRWIFTPFVFIPELQYRIASHPRSECVNTPVRAAGFLVTNLLPVRLPPYGWLPQKSTLIFGRYLWEGNRTVGCDRVIVPATSVFPIEMNRLGHRAEEYFTSHPEYGTGLSHVTAINDRATGRFEIWTSMQYFQMD
jgi:hypothetical protein